MAIRIFCGDTIDLQVGITVEVNALLNEGATSDQVRDAVSTATKPERDKLRAKAIEVLTGMFPSAEMTTRDPGE